MRHEPRDDREDARLRDLFAPLVESPDDDGFVAAVVGRIRRRNRTRRLVLTAAAVIGGLLAFGPVYELAVAFGEGIEGIITGWAGTDWLPQYRAAGMGVLIALLSPLLPPMLDD